MCIHLIPLQEKPWHKQGMLTAAPRLEGGTKRWDRALCVILLQPHLKGNYWRMTAKEILSHSAIFFLSVGWSVDTRMTFVLPLDAAATLKHWATLRPGPQKTDQVVNNFQLRSFSVNMYPTYYSLWSIHSFYLSPGLVRGSMTLPPIVWEQQEFWGTIRSLNATG